MSVEIETTISRPIELAALLRRTQELFGELLALDVPPDLVHDAKIDMIELLDPDIWFQVQLTSGDGCYVTTYGPYDEYGEPDEPTLLAVHPHRTCIGVMFAVVILRAAAELGDGVVDGQLVAPPLPRNDLGFGERCERYLRQLKRYRNWPGSIALDEDETPAARARAGASLFRWS